MKEKLGYAHVSVIEDLYYILHEESVSTYSSGINSHYVMVYAVVEDCWHRAKLVESIAPYMTPFEEVPST